VRIRSRPPVAALTILRKTKAGKLPGLCLSGMEIFSLPALLPEKREALLLSDF
jgi:hypothetical protein